MGTEAASTAVRTRTRAPRAAATRSTPCTQTAGRASVSRRPCQCSRPVPPRPPRDAPPTHPPRGSIVATPHGVLVSKEEARGKETRTPPGASGARSGRPPGAAFCRHSAGSSSPQDQAPLLCVAAGFLRVLFLSGGRRGWPQAGGQRGGGSVRALEGSFCSGSTGVSSPTGRHAGDSFPS